MATRRWTEQCASSLGGRDGQITDGRSSRSCNVGHYLHILGWFRWQLSFGIRYDLVEWMFASVVKKFIRDHSHRTLCGIHHVRLGFSVVFAILNASVKKQVSIRGQCWWASHCNLKRKALQVHLKSKFKWFHCERDNFLPLFCFHVLKGSTLNLNGLTKFLISVLNCLPYAPHHPQKQGFPCFGVLAFQQDYFGRCWIFWEVAKMPLAMKYSDLQKICASFLWTHQYRSGTTEPRRRIFPKQAFILLLNNLLRPYCLTLH